MLKTYTQKELEEIIRLHGLWVSGKEGGVTADLSHSNLSHSDLSHSDLRGADFSHSDLRGSNLNNTLNSKLLLAKLQISPATGSFRAYKKSREGEIIELEILEDSKRLNAIGERKCRANKVKVVRFLDTEETVLSSIYAPNFKYKVGDILEVKDFNNSVTEPCGSGIHYFLTIEEAENY